MISVHIENNMDFLLKYKLLWMLYLCVITQAHIIHRRTVKDSADTQKLAEHFRTPQKYIIEPIQTLTKNADNVLALPYDAVDFENKEKSNEIGDKIEEVNLQMTIRNVDKVVKAADADTSFDLKDDSIFSEKNYETSDNTDNLNSESIQTGVIPIVLADKQNVLTTQSKMGIKALQNMKETTQKHSENIAITQSSINYENILDTKSTQTEKESQTKLPLAVETEKQQVVLESEFEPKIDLKNLFQNLVNSVDKDKLLQTSDESNSNTKISNKDDSIIEDLTYHNNDLRNIENDFKKSSQIYSGREAKDSEIAIKTTETISTVSTSIDSKVKDNEIKTKTSGSITPIPALFSSNTKNSEIVINANESKLPIDSKYLFSDLVTSVDDQFLQMYGNKNAESKNPNKVSETDNSIVEDLTYNLNGLRNFEIVNSEDTKIGGITTKIESDTQIFTAVPSELENPNLLKTHLRNFITENSKKLTEISNDSEVKLTNSATPDSIVAELINSEKTPETSYLISGLEITNAINNQIQKLPKQIKISENLEKIVKNVESNQENFNDISVALKRKVKSENALASTVDTKATPEASENVSVTTIDALAVLTIPKNIEKSSVTSENVIEILTNQANSRTDQVSSENIHLVPTVLATDQKPNKPTPGKPENTSGKPITSASEKSVIEALISSTSKPVKEIKPPLLQAKPQTTTGLPSSKISPDKESAKQIHQNGPVRRPANPNQSAPVTSQTPATNPAWFPNLPNFPHLHNQNVPPRRPVNPNLSTSVPTQNPAANPAWFPNLPILPSLPNLPNLQNQNIPPQRPVNPNFPNFSSLPAAPVLPAFFPNPFNTTTTANQNQLPFPWNFRPANFTNIFTPNRPPTSPLAARSNNQPKPPKIGLGNLEIVNTEDIEKVAVNTKIEYETPISLPVPSQLANSENFPKTSSKNLENFITENSEKLTEISNDSAIKLANSAIQDSIVTELIDSEKIPGTSDSVKVSKPINHIQISPVNIKISENLDKFIETIKPTQEKEADAIKNVYVAKSVDIETTSAGLATSGNVGKLSIIAASSKQIPSNNQNVPVRRPVKPNLSASVTTQKPATNPPINTATNPAWFPNLPNFPSLPTAPVLPAFFVNPFNNTTTANQTQSTFGIGFLAVPWNWRPRNFTNRFTPNRIIGTPSLPTSPLAARSGNQFEPEAARDLAFWNAIFQRGFTNNTGVFKQWSKANDTQDNNNNNNNTSQTTAWKPWNFVSNGDFFKIPKINYSGLNNTATIPANTQVIHLYLPLKYPFQGQIVTSPAERQNDETIKHEISNKDKFIPKFQRSALKSEEAEKNVEVIAKKSQAEEKASLMFELELPKPIVQFVRGLMDSFFTPTN